MSAAVAVDFLAAALELAGDGLEILPLTPGGKPPLGRLARHGVKSASSDFAQITEWWTSEPNANIGIRVPEGYTVLDIDPRNGGTESYTALISEVAGMAEAVANTLRTETPTGAFHVWLRLPEGFADHLCGRISRYPGIDIMSPKKYLVAPPSLRSDCGGRRYTWRDADAEVAEAPAGLVALISGSGGGSAAKVDPLDAAEVSAWLAANAPDPEADPSPELADVLEAVDWSAGAHDEHLRTATRLVSLAVLGECAGISTALGHLAEDFAAEVSERRGTGDAAREHRRNVRSAIDHTRALGATPWSEIAGFLAQLAAIKEKRTTRMAEATAPPEDPAALLDDLEAFFRRYCVLPSEHHFTALVLWCVHTHVYDAFDTTPRLFLDSPVPGSGKTRVLELVEVTGRKPLSAFNASAAALIRTIDAGDRAILLDEIDTLYAKGAGTEDITACINAGYKRGATVPRCVGQGMDIEVVELSAFAPMALAGLHANVPEAVRSRSIHFRMRKRKPTETLERYQRRRATAQAEPIREALEAWANAAFESLQDAEPELPDGVEDRPAEIWEPLLAVADAVGGEWPEMAREACKSFVFARKAEAPSLGVEMLSAIREAMKGHDRISTPMLISNLIGLGEGSPWPEARGPLTAKDLARILRPFEVWPRQFKDAKGAKARGYLVHGDGGLGDAWERYSPPESEVEL